MHKIIIGTLICLFSSACIGPCAPMWERWNGEAELARAESAKKVQVEDAKGKLEAAKLLGDAEVARARGAAEANKILGESLKNNEAYLRYLWIQNLEKAASKEGKEVIYVPTEANIPILEAGKR